MRVNRKGSGDSGEVQRSKTEIRNDTKGYATRERMAKPFITEVRDIERHKITPHPSGTKKIEKLAKAYGISSPISSE